MATEQFYMIITTAGAALYADAIAHGTAVSLTEMAVGDSDGAYYPPDADQTELANELYRDTITLIDVDPDNENWVICELAIPSTEGGYTIREIGVFTSDGTLFAVGKMPATYKPLLTEGSGKDMVCRAILEVSNTAAVTLSVDPSVVLASREYVDSTIQTQNAQAFTTTGTSTAYVLTPTPAISANAANLRFRVKFHAAAGATPTLAISGKAALNLKYCDASGAKQPVTATQITINWVADVENDGTDWVILHTAGDNSTALYNVIQAQIVQAFTTGGTSTAYTLTPTPAIAANAANLRFRVKFHAASGATPTLAISGKAALNLKYCDASGAKQPVTATQIPINWVADVENDGTDWVVLAIPPLAAYTPWTTVTAFTAAPASTSTLTMTSDLTASILPGYPIRYTIGGVVYYGIVSAIANNLLTVNGAPLSGNVTALAYGPPEKVRTIRLSVNGFYEDATNAALLASDVLGCSPVWRESKAYLVGYRVHSRIHDSHATHGKVTVLVNSADVNSSAGGLTIAADATWYGTVIDINVSNYDINPAETFEVSVTAGGTGDAVDLVVDIVVVYP